MIIHYFNISQLIPNRDLVYLKTLSRKFGYKIEYFQDNSPGIRKFINLAKKCIKNKNDAEVIWIGYTAHILVPLIKIISNKKVVFNASNSLYDGMIISRKVGSVFSLKSIKYWLIDFFSFLFSDLLLVETNKQKEYISQKFFVKKNKIIRAWTGADDEFFFKDESIKKEEAFTVVFRGGFLPESGVDCAVYAANLLKDSGINFRIIGWGMLENKVRNIVSENNLKNVELFIGRDFTTDKLRELMISCHVCLGQLSNHSKLSRTIPYKAFESLAMGMPYLTSRTSGILELLIENETCACFDPGNPLDLAKKILELRDDQNLLTSIAKNGYDLYNKELRSDIITKKLIEEIFPR